MYVCQSSPSHTSALGTWKWNEGLDSKKLCCDCEKTWFVSLTCGRSRCDLSARLVQVVTPFSLRVNVLTARLILISGLLQCYFRGRPPVKQDLEQWYEWYVIPERLTKAKDEKFFASFGCFSALQHVSDSTRRTANIHSQKCIPHKMSILIWVPFSRRKTVNFEKPKFKWTKQEKGATTVVFI